MTASAEIAWQQALSGWGIPEAILAQAPESPWIHPVAQFIVDARTPQRRTPAEERALEALPASGSVLDVGSGGGKAAFALVPPAGTVIGVDHQLDMLTQFASAAEQRGVQHSEILGDWPVVAPLAPMADVVTCHHVLYNVSHLTPFVMQLTTHARRRVVTEIPWQHPLMGLTSAWREFWDLDRPEGPTAEDALGVIREAGIDARLERFRAPFDGPPVPFEDQVRYSRIRLCLTADRDDDIAAFLQANPPEPERELAVIWWESHEGEH